MPAVYLALFVLHSKSLQQPFCESVGQDLQQQDSSPISVWNSKLKLRQSRTKYSDKLELVRLLCFVEMTPFFKIGQRIVTGLKCKQSLSAYWCDPDPCWWRDVKLSIADCHFFTDCESGKKVIVIFFIMWQLHISSLTGTMQRYERGYISSLPWLRQEWLMYRCDGLFIYRTVHVKTVGKSFMLNKHLSKNSSF